MSFNEIVKKLRKEKGMSATILAERLGVSPITISAWEKGANKPCAAKINALANYFGVTIEYLFGIDEKSNDSKNAASKSDKKPIEDVVKKEKSSMPIDTKKLILELDDMEIDWEKMRMVNNMQSKLITRALRSIHIMMRECGKK